MSAQRRNSVFILSCLLTTLLAACAPSTQVQAPFQNPETGPLYLEEQGSFFVGGEVIQTDALTGDAEGNFLGPNQGGVAVNQMYVQYQIPVATETQLPIVMIHGGTLTGKTYETTPDGRMGWAEYFLRKDFPVYLVDQVSRGRSGFDATIINEVRMGLRPPSDLPNILRVSQEAGWTWWRFGPEYGTAFEDTQFPVEAGEEFVKQGIPDLNALLPADDNPTWENLAALANELNGAVLLGHSQSAFFPHQAAFVDESNVKGMIAIETGLCPEPETFTPEQLSIMTTIPSLIVFGDHIDDAAPEFAQTWQTSLMNCRNIVQMINDAGGDATLLHLPEAGVFGNSHMMMQDRNNLQVADLLINWINEHVE